MATIMKAARQAVKTQSGTVISAGKMQKTITVQMKRQKWNSHLRKNFITHYNVFAHDPTGVSLTGDVVTLAPFHASKTVKHTISDIVVPFAIPLSERPSLLSPTERGLAALEAKKQREEFRRQRKQALKGKVEGDVVELGNGVKVVVESVGSDGNVLKTRTVQHGREVLPGGKHKFGKINEEARRGRAKADELVEKAKRNQRELERAQGGAKVMI